MEEIYFESFLKLLDDNLILKESTAIGVMVKFKNHIKEIKSETLKALQTKGDNSNYYLDYLINEIEKQDYIKEIDLSHVQHWLDEYKITIEEIFDMKYQNNAIATVIDTHYVDIDKRSDDKDKAFSVQTSFLYYFCNYYAAELITFLNSQRVNKIIHKVQEPQISKQFKDDILNAFLKEISNERDIYQSAFIQCYDFGIKAFTDYLKSEIKENLLILPAEKINLYLDFVEDKISSTPYFNIDNNAVDRWISMYNLENFAFPFIENKEVKKLISMFVNFHQLTEDDKTLIEDIQIDFYCYAAMTEAHIIMDFIVNKRNNSISKPMEVNTENEQKIKWIGKPSQLGFIIGKLAELGYIQAPEKPSGDINYTQFAKLVKNTFDVETTEATLSKYLNLESEKGSETVRKFHDNGFDIPHVKTIS
jgi:hypothetical protein